MSSGHCPALAVLAIALSCVSSPPVHGQDGTRPGDTPALAPDLGHVDRRSGAYQRFRRWVARAAAGDPGYAFAPADAAWLYRIEGDEGACRLAVEQAGPQVEEAERAIAAGEPPPIAGDSYLYAGPMIEDLALALASCPGQVDPARRARWSAYARQVLHNLWNHEDAQWGGRTHPWSGWANDNPANNYYYSFLRASMTWALATEDEEWLADLRQRRLPPLVEHLRGLPGGGSLEGTGYGISHAGLFELFRLWRDSTGELPGAVDQHAADSIDYWIHATVPTLDHHAPLGDQARESQPALHDYHRRLVLEARQLTSDAAARERASWWLRHISVPRMQHGMNFRHDLLPAGAGGAPPDGLHHHAAGVGHLFARSAWTRDALWLAFVAGPYSESHAHQDQGAFTLFSGDWLAVTENIWTHSGIQQETPVHNVLRFQRGDTIAAQRAGTVSSMRVRPSTPGQLHVAADLTPAYAGSGMVRSWRRELNFGGRRLLVRDHFEVAPGTRAVFQVNVPVRPRIDGDKVRAGKLRLKVLHPAGATIEAVDWRKVDPDEFLSGWRVDIAGGTDRYEVELSTE